MWFFSFMLLFFSHPHAQQTQSSVNWAQLEISLFLYFKIILLHEKGGLIAFRSVHSIFKNHILALCCILFSLIITQSQTWFLIYWHLLNSWSMGVDYAGRVLCTSSRHARVKFPVWKYSNDSNLQILVRQLLNCKISLRQKYVLSRLSCQMVSIIEWVPVYTG